MTPMTVKRLSSSVICLPRIEAVRGEAPPPQPVAEYDDVWTAESIVGRFEVSTQRWQNAERTEVARTHALTLESLRQAGSNHGWLPRFHHRQ